MALDSAGSVTVAKLELNKDGFLKSAGGALVIPYLNGAYDLFLFPTDTEADANDTSNAEQVADDIKNSLINDLSQAYDFSDFASMISGSSILPLGKVLNTKGYYSEGDGGSASYIKTTGASPNAGNPSLTGGGYAKSKSKIIIADEWGAREGSGNDNSSIIQAALATGRKVFLTPNKTYYVKNLTSVENSGLLSIGGRASIRVIDGAGNNGLTINSNNFTLDGVNILGGNLGPWNDDVLPFVDRDGLVVGNTVGTNIQINGVTVKNCDISGFDRFGLLGKEVQVGFEFGKRVVYDNVRIYNCYVNWAISDRHEYCTFTNCYGTNGREGLQLTGGNNSFVACHFEWNYFNCFLGDSSNSGHGQFVGCSFNHSCTDTAGNKGLVCQDVSLSAGDVGHIFSACAFWFAPIDIIRCTGVIIGTSQIVGSAIKVEGGGFNSVSGNYISDDLVITTVGTTFTMFRNNMYANPSEAHEPAYYGDVYVISSTLSSGFPIPWIIGTDFRLTFTNMDLKYQQTDFPTLHNGNTGIIPYVNNYNFDIDVVFDAVADDMAVMKLKIYKSAVFDREYIVSNNFKLGQTECTLNLNKTLLMAPDETYEVTLKSVSATELSITAINLRVQSKD